MVNISQVVVIGAGHAGANLCFFLRSSGWAGRVTLIDQAGSVPFQRPPLSKGYLSGKQQLADVEFRPLSFYRDHGIELILGHPVQSIDRCSRSVRLADHDPVEYDLLVLATGATPRLPRIPGVALDGVFTLASLEDSDALRGRIGDVNRVAVLGGGFIGLETAAMVAEVGKDVIVFEAADRVMSRVVTPSISEYFQNLHTSNGVELRLSSTVRELVGSDGRVSGVVGSDGSRIDADLVIVGVGSAPNDRLAREAGLSADDGVLVDGTLSTTDPNIVAIGDCARFPCTHSRGEVLRLESVQNATDQAHYIAGRVRGEASKDYDATPWFWTEQFASRLQIAGLTAGYDRLEAVQNSDTKFSVYCYAGDRFLGCESVNSPKDHLQARRRLSGHDRRPARQ